MTRLEYYWEDHRILTDAIRTNTPYTDPALDITIFPKNNREKEIFKGNKASLTSYACGYRRKLKILNALSVDLGSPAPNLYRLSFLKNNQCPVESLLTVLSLLDKLAP